MQAMRAATQQAADAYWRLLGEMNLRYMADLRALELVVEEFKKPPLMGVRDQVAAGFPLGLAYGLGRHMHPCRA
jgi:hypothetical protein